VRTVYCCLLLWLLQCTTAAAAVAQAGSMPEWIVPVLRLVSSTHVEPTTGVVLSAEGLVLVPGDFAARGQEIVVLDGGTDIIQHGRPARLQMKFPELGLAVLQADGLQRSGAPLAPVNPASGDSLRLRAFPPAELIAEGAPPLDLLTAIDTIAENGAPMLAAGASLPNVTGALLDNCGNLAGLSLADGVQSLTPARATQYHWATELRAVLTELNLPVSGTSCTRDTAAIETAPPATAEASAGAPEAEQSGAAAVASEPPLAGDVQPAEQLSPDAVGTEAVPTLEELPPFEKAASTVEAPSPTPASDTSEPRWPWLLASLLLLISGIVVHWLRRGHPARSTAVDAHETGDADAAESQAAVVANLHANEAPCRLVLRGAYANGQSFEAATRVMAQAVNAEIGRGAVDLTIESPAVSRRHARLSGTREALTLTDLGSSNGSSINGVPCLEGEVMYVEPGAVIVLGDARFTVIIEDGPPAGGRP